MKRRFFVLAGPLRGTYDEGLSTLTQARYLRRLLAPARPRTRAPAPLFKAGAPLFSVTLSVCAQAHVLLGRFYEPGGSAVLEAAGSLCRKATLGPRIRRGDSLGNGGSLLARPPGALPVQDPSKRCMERRRERL